MPTHSNAQRRQVIGECCRRGARRIPRRPTGGTTGRDSASRRRSPAWLATWVNHARQALHSPRCSSTLAEGTGARSPSSRADSASRATSQSMPSIVAQCRLIAPAGSDHIAAGTPLQPCKTVDAWWLKLPAVVACASTVARVVRERRGARVQGSIGFVVVVLVVEESFGVVEGVGAGLAVVEVGWW